MRRGGLLLLLWALALPARADVVTPRGRLRFVPGPGALGLAQELAATGDRDRDEVAKDVGRDWDGVTEVRVTLDGPSFRAALPRGEKVPRWAQGVAFPGRNLVVLRAFPGDPEARATLRHELSHIALGRLTHGAVPRWFLEGLAMLRERMPWTDQGPSLIVAALTGRLLPFAELRASFPAGASDAGLAYAESADFVAFLVGRSGEPAVRAVLRDVVAGRSFDAAVQARLGAKVPALEQQWRRSLARWELVVHLLTESDLLWVLLAGVVVWAAWRLRRRKRRQLAGLDAEDRLAELRAFAATPAVWADEPPAADESEDEPDDGPQDALDARLDALLRDPAEDDDEAGEDGERSLGPKKPTLH